MSSPEKGAKGVGGIVTTGEKATTYVETVKAQTDSEVNTSSGECSKPRYTVSGTMRASGKTIDGATVSGGGQSTTSGPSGAYSLTYDEDTTFTLTFSLASHHDAVRDVGPLKSNQQLDVTLIRICQVSGTVKSEKSPVGAVSVSGGGKSTTTVPEGTYALTFDENTTVTLTFSLQHHNDKTKEIGPLKGDVKKVDVDLTRTQCRVSGTLRFVDGKATDLRVDIENTKIGRLMTKGDEKSRTYALDVKEGTKIKILAQDADSFSRDPEFIELTVTGNTEKLDFTYTRERAKITGTVEEGSAAVAGVAVTLAGVDTPATTTDKGAFEFANLLAGYAYKLTAEHRHFTFEPPKHTVGVLRNDPKIVFKATRKPWSIKGTVKFADDKTKQAEVELSGNLLMAARTVKTGKAGVYSFEGVPAGGKYTVKPKTSAKYNVTTSAIVIDELAADETGQDFDGAWKTWSISGNVKEQLTSSRVNLARVPLTLSGGASATASSGNNGNYTFSNVPAGGTYVITPDPLTPYAFNPVNLQAANVSAAVLAQNFIAKWFPPDAGSNNEPLQTTYGLDVKDCPRCGQRTITHAASPIRETQQSYDLCKELLGIIFKCGSGTKTMVGVLVCDDNGAERRLAAHSGGDHYPDNWQTKAALAGFIVATMANDPRDLVDHRGRKPLPELTQLDNEIGLCAAPKLIQAANLAGYTPLAMSEISLKLDGHTNGKTVSSCRTCQVIVAQMLCDV